MTLGYGTPRHGDDDDLTDEATYERVRSRRLAAGAAGGVSRRGLLRLTAGAGLGAGLGTGLAAALTGGAHAAEPGSGIVKPLPPELFFRHGPGGLRHAVEAGRGGHRALARGPAVHRPGARRSYPKGRRHPAGRAGR